MNKVIIINKKHKETGQGLLSALANNLILPVLPSIIDLPFQVHDVLINNNKIKFKVTSWCMFPVIWADDILKVEFLKPQEAKIGDIIVYKSAGRAYCHRLVKTYQDNGKLFFIAAGESGNKKKYLQFGDAGAIPADNILGKVVEVRRKGLCFKPDELKLSLLELLAGRIKLSFWVFSQSVKRIVSKIFFKLQSVKPYRYILRVILRNKLSFFVGCQLDKYLKESNNFCFYRKFKEFEGVFTGKEGLYHLSARARNFPLGNISLLFDADDSGNMRCILFNLFIRIPWRGGGIGRQLAEKALLLCSKANVNRVEVFLPEEDVVSCGIFKKLGFTVINKS